MSTPAPDAALRAATIEVLAESGWDGVTLEKVAERAGRARVTLWRQGVTREALLAALLDDLAEDFRFSSAFCFTMPHHVHTPAAQDAIFAETHRVLRPGGVFVGSDSIASAGLRAFHHHDVYTPVDPLTLADRLEVAGFADVSVRVVDDWFAFSAIAA